MPTAMINGVSLSYADEGAGPLLLLLHAFPLSGQMWQAQLAVLKHAHRVIVPDLRGLGASELGTDTASMEQHADDMAGLLDHVKPGVERVVVAGLSMGGYIAFAFLRKHAKKVGAMILADTRPQADSDEAKQAREKNARLVEEKGVNEIATQMLPTLTSSGASESLRANVRRMIETNRADGVAAALRAMAARADSTPLLATINVPVLVLVGAEDRLTPPFDARKMHEAIQSSRLIELPRAGHLSNLEAPAAFNGAVVDFLRDIS